jgi:hypothetical protein
MDFMKTLEVAIIGLLAIVATLLGTGWVLVCIFKPLIEWLCRTGRKQGKGRAK